MAQTVKNLPAMWETHVRPLGREDALEKGMATHSRNLVWRIPWTEEPGRLQFTGSHDWGTEHTHSPVQGTSIQSLLWEDFTY